MVMTFEANRTQGSPTNGGRASGSGIVLATVACFAVVAAVHRLPALRRQI